jgi:hypothetical protein
VEVGIEIICTFISWCFSLVPTSGLNFCFFVEGGGEEGIEKEIVGD